MTETLKILQMNEDLVLSSQVVSATLCEVIVSDVERSGSQVENGFNDT